MKSIRIFFVMLGMKFIPLFDKTKADMLKRGKAEMSFDDWGLAEYLVGKKEWESGAPKAGMEAPDFEVEKLTAGGDRTGEFFQLSSVRGKPIALVMGSYT